MSLFEVSRSLTIIKECLVVRLRRDGPVLVLLDGVVVVGTQGPRLHLLLPPAVLFRVEILVGLHHVVEAGRASHDEPLLDELELRDELLLLELELVQGGAGLGSVSLQEVGLLHEVDLQLFLQALTVTIVQLCNYIIGRNQ